MVAALEQEWSFAQAITATRSASGSVHVATVIFLALTLNLHLYC